MNINETPNSQNKMYFDISYEINDTLIRLENNSWNIISKFYMHINLFV